MGKQRTGQRRIKGCRHCGRHTAAQKGACRTSAQMQNPCQPRPDGGPHMHNRPFTAQRCPASQRGNIYKGSLEPATRRHAPVMKSRRINDIRHPERAPFGHKIINKKTNQKAAQCGHQDQMPGRQGFQKIMHRLVRGAIAQLLNQQKPFAKDNRHCPDQGAHHQRQNGQDKLLALHQATQARKNMQISQRFFGQNTPCPQNAAIVMFHTRYEYIALPLYYRQFICQQSF